MGTEDGPIIVYFWAEVFSPGLSLFRVTLSHTHKLRTPPRFITLATVSRASCSSHCTMAIHCYYHHNYSRLPWQNQKGDARDGYDKMKAYDMLVQAESGLASVTGSPDAPSRVGVSCCDIASGMAAHAGVCEALFARERHPDKLGEGLAISMFDGMADWMAVPLLFYEEGGVELKRVGLRHPSISPYTTYKAKDGNDVLSIDEVYRFILYYTKDLDDDSVATEADGTDDEHGTGDALEEQAEAA